jgi:hypothetical protein
MPVCSLRLCCAPLTLPDYINSLRAPSNPALLEHIAAVTDVVLHMAVGDDALASLVFSIVMSTCSHVHSTAPNTPSSSACSNLLSLAILHPAFGAKRHDEARAIQCSLNSSSSRRASQEVSVADFIEGSKLHQWRSSEGLNAGILNLYSFFKSSLRPHCRKQHEAPPCATAARCPAPAHAHGQSRQRGSQRASSHQNCPLAFCPRLRGPRPFAAPQ